MEISLCLLALIVSSVYIFCFLSTTTYLLVINRCKFNKRTKVVISILALTMSLQISSSLMTYIMEQRQGYCSVYPLAYALLSQQHVVIMIIYSFLVCRMLSVYYKMALATQPIPSCKARWARRLSNCQNGIIGTYLLVYSSFIWSFHLLWSYQNPNQALTVKQ